MSWKKVNVALSADQNVRKYVFYGEDVVAESVLYKYPTYDIFEPLFNSLCGCSCGACCSKDYLCDKCEINTLQANGLPLTLIPEIHGLKAKSGCGHNYSFEFSDLYNKLRELIHEQRQEYELKH